VSNTPWSFPLISRARRENTVQYFHSVNCNPVESIERLWWVWSVYIGAREVAAYVRRYRVFWWSELSVSGVRHFVVGNSQFCCSAYYEERILDYGNWTGGCYKDGGVRIWQTPGTNVWPRNTSFQDNTPLPPPRRTKHTQAPNKTMALARISQMQVCRTIISQWSVWHIRVLVICLWRRRRSWTNYRRYCGCYLFCWWLLRNCLSILWGFYGL
jgi:hypothetical protein